jgi:hypothetical protein
VVGDLIMLPVRIGVRATRLWLRAAEETISVAAGATTRLVGLAASRASGHDDGTATELEPRRGRAPGEGLRAEARPAAPPQTKLDQGSRGSPSAPSSPSAATEAERPTAPAPSPPEPAPTHVSEEPTLVEELAEPGAEDGAGAEIHIAEPWEGYARMNAKEVVSRLSGADPAQLAAVQLYESSHRHRQTVLNAVQRELRSANGRSG